MSVLESRVSNLVQQNTLPGMIADAVTSRDAAIMPHTEEAPEQSGVFSLDKPFQTLYSSTGDALPDLAIELFERARIQQSQTLLGYLASRTEVSSTTGCWAVVDAWRDAKGYSFCWDAREFGFENKKSVSGFAGMPYHAIAYILHQRIQNPDYVRPSKALDHKCRNTACCNPNHLEEVDRVENNRRQQQAHPLEKALAVGQVILAPSGYKKIDEATAACLLPETGIIVNARDRPYELVKEEETPLMVVGKPIEDDLLAALRPPAQEKRERRSRVRLPYIHEGQSTLVEVEPVKRQTLRKRYEQTMLGTD